MRQQKKTIGHTRSRGGQELAPPTRDAACMCMLRRPVLPSLIFSAST